MPAASSRREVAKPRVAACKAKQSRQVFYFSFFVRRKNGREYGRSGIKEYRHMIVYFFVVLRGFYQKVMWRVRLFFLKHYYER